MKTFFLASIVLMMASCGNDKGKTERTGEEKLVDSLEMDVNKGHNLGMAKMGKLTRYQQYTQQLRDSIAALPPAAKAKAGAYTLQLDTLQHQLDSAETAMDKWMNEYSFDSLKNDMTLRAAYLNTEKIKIEGMVGLILTVINKGDSLLKIARPGVN